ncbi:hypothetical protein E4U50_002879 [Claviceps purpurea]|nr:hypothetical protein E4U50_002879 [Claviceps purpurea]
MFDMKNVEKASRPEFPPAEELKLVPRRRGHCEQVPPFQFGAHFTFAEMMQSLLDLFDEIEEESREGFEDLGQRLDRLGLKISTLNMNFSARLNNSKVIHEHVRLTPLHSVLTGELLPNCPSTLRELHALSVHEVEALLVELGEVVVRGPVGGKRRQFETAFGVMSRVVQTRRQP